MFDIFSGVFIVGFHVLERSPMETEFVEKYQQLKDMVPGDIAVSKDRNKFYICGFHMVYNNNKPLILDLNNLTNQYTDKRDMNELIRMLKPGDKFVSTR